MIAELYILTGTETLQPFCRMFVTVKIFERVVLAYLKWNNC